MTNEIDDFMPALVSWIGDHSVFTPREAAAAALAAMWAHRWTLQHLQTIGVDLHSSDEGQA